MIASKIEITPVSTFVVDESRWLHGEGMETSYLLRPSDRKQCCVGLYLEACGVPQSYLSFVDSAQNVSFTLNLRKQLPPEITSATGLLEVYHINDSPDLSEEQRKELLTEYLGDIGIRILFQSEVK